MSYRMTRQEREAFLAGVHVGVLGLTEPGRGPLAVPIWYGYEPGGELWFITDRDSRKGKLLAEGARVSLCAQTETAPYQYVAVEGPVTRIEPSDLERDTRRANLLHARRERAERDERSALHEPGIGHDDRHDSRG